jgi:hypothetical protein
MTTASDIITRAYRDPNIIGTGKTPTAAEVTEALPLLNTIIQNAFGRVVGEYPEDWPLGTFYTAPDGKQYPFWPNSSKPQPQTWRYPPQNSRLITRLSSATTVYLEPYPDDGAVYDIVDNGNEWSTNVLTVDANGRTIEQDDGTFANTYAISTAPAGPLKLVYRADTSRWVRVPVLDDSGEGAEIMPLPTEFDDWFSISLAARLCPRYSKTLPEMLIAVHRDLEKQMKTRFRQTARVNVHRRGEDQRTIQTLDGGYGGERNLLR